MGDREAEYGTVWYQKIDSEEIDGIEGEYELESKGGEVIVTIYPRNEGSVDSASEKILFPWNRIMRIDAHEPPQPAESVGSASSDV